MRNIQKSLVIAGGLASAALFGADSSRTIWNFDSHIRSSSNKSPVRSHTALDLPKSLVPGTFDQSIDHFGALSGQNFKQRYWVSSEYAAASDSAPIILHICGEGDAEQGYFLKDNAIEWAKSLGAHIVYLEHRYYGQSLPFADLTSDHLQYLTLDNVLEDLATFQKWISKTQNWKGKWISVGGSYSGTISAIYRYKHPELVAGALAASAPMIAGTGVAEGNFSDVAGLSSTDPSGGSGDRQWVYQACTTFAFWQTDLSTIYTPSAWLCQQLFGNAPFANGASYNQNYEAPFVANSAAAPSNILFTYGTSDIWTTIGLAPKDNANPNITIRLINGAGHHFDLNYPDPADTSDVLAARATFLDLAKSWLGI